MRVPRLAWCDAPTHVAVVVTECCFHVAFLCLKLAHIEGADGPMQAFQLEFANGSVPTIGSAATCTRPSIRICPSAARAQAGPQIYDLPVAE